MKLRKGGIDEHTTCGQHLESQRYLQDIVDLLVALADTVCIVSLKKQSLYAAQLLLICLSPPGHLMLLLLKLLQ